MALINFKIKFLNRHSDYFHMRTCHSTKNHVVTVSEKDSKRLECRADGVPCCTGPFIYVSDTLKGDETRVPLLHGPGWFRNGIKKEWAMFFVGDAHWRPRKAHSDPAVVVVSGYMTHAFKGGMCTAVWHRNRPYGHARFVFNDEIVASGVWVDDIPYGEWEFSYPSKHLSVRAVFSGGNAVGDIILADAYSVADIIHVTLDGSTPCIKTERFTFLPTFAGVVRCAVLFFQRHGLKLTQPDDHEWVAIDTHAMTQNQDLTTAGDSEEPAIESPMTADQGPPKKRRVETQT